MLEQIVGNNLNKLQAMQDGMAMQSGMMEGGQLVPSRLRSARTSAQPLPAALPPA